VGLRALDDDGNPQNTRPPKGPGSPDHKTQTLVHFGWLANTHVSAFRAIVLGPLSKAKLRKIHPDLLLLLTSFQEELALSSPHILSGSR